MGMLVGIILWVIMMWLYKCWFVLQKVDDILGVFYMYVVVGILGGICVGFFVEFKFCRYMNFVVMNFNGLFYGGNGVMQLVKQIGGVVFVIGWNLVVMLFIMFGIQFIMLFCMLEEYLRVGDDVEYGEEVYVFWGDGECFDVM